VIDPPVPDTPNRVPSVNTPKELLTGKESKVLLLVEESVALTTATTPLAIGFVLPPVARQVRDPTPELQLRVLPAAVRAGPATELRETTSVGAYPIVH
jgi:hypothetical protein